MLDKNEHPVRYTGACIEKRAERLYLYANSKVKATWEGEFCNGVFIGEGPRKAMIEGRVEPIPGDGYLVGIGKDQKRCASVLLVAKVGKCEGLDGIPKENMQYTTLRYVDRQCS